MTYAKHDFDFQKEKITLWGCEYEVVFTFKCGEVPADHILPNGRLDLSKYEPFKGPLARSAAFQASP
jgi:hypothetical protein